MKACSLLKNSILVCLVSLPLALAQDTTQKVLTDLIEGINPNAEKKADTKIEENPTCADCTNPATTPPLSIPVQNKKITAACAASIPQDQEDTPKAIDREIQLPCELPNRFYKWNQRFSIQKRKKDQIIEIQTSIRLQLQAPKVSKERAQFILDQSIACGPELNKYWHNYGIDLKINFDTDQNPTTEKPLYNVKLFDSFGRSNAYNYYFKGIEVPVKAGTTPVVIDGSGKPVAKMAPTQACNWACKTASAALLLGMNKKSCEDTCEIVREREYCLLLLHETGHLLGLPDEYAEKKIGPDGKETAECPDRWVSNEHDPWSAMAMTHTGFFDSIELPTDVLTGAGVSDVDKFFAKKVEFMPRHIKAVLDPLCPSQNTSVQPETKVDVQPEVKTQP